MFASFLSLGTCCFKPKQDTSSPSQTTLIKAWRHGETEANVQHLMAGGADDDPAGLTALNANGKKQAQELGKRLVSEGPLDIIYSSDLSRALDTAKAVQEAFRAKGKFVEIRLSKQLRETFHGKFQLQAEKFREEKSKVRMAQELAADKGREYTDKEDRFRFWKIHPLIANDEILKEDIIDAQSYLDRKETTPETRFQMWKRIKQEFLRIAKLHPGKTVGISMHGGGLNALRTEMKKNPKGIYLAVHISNPETKVGDKVIIPAADKVDNCCVVYFKGHCTLKGSPGPLDSLSMVGG